MSYTKSATEGVLRVSSRKRYGVVGVPKDSAAISENQTWSTAKKQWMAEESNLVPGPGSRLNKAVTRESWGPKLGSGLKSWESQLRSGGVEGKPSANHERVAKKQWRRVPSSDGECCYW